MPGTAAVNWYTCRRALPLLGPARLAGMLTLTASPGAKACAGVKVSVLVPPPVIVPGRLPRSREPNTRKLAALALLMGCANVTATAEPTGALVALRAGLRLSTAMGSVTTNEVAEVAVPAGVVTVIGPVVAPAGTVSTSSVAEFTR